MKRLLLLILSVLMIVCFSVFAFAACGEDKPDNGGQGTEQPDTPDTPDTPENPDDPGTPDTPDTPVTPDRPGAGDETVGDYVVEEEITELYFVTGVVNMTVGKTQNTMPQGITTSDAVVFTSSNPEVATVDATTGTVYAVKEGQSTITVQNFGRQASYLVNVTLGGLAPQIYFESLINQDLTVALGEQLNLLPMVKFNGELYSDLTVTYTVSNDGVGTVDANGVFTPVANGTTKVTVNVEWRDVVAAELECTLEITVIANNNIMLNGGVINTVELYLTGNHAGETYATSEVVEVVAFEGETQKVVSLEVVNNDGVVAFDPVTATITALKAGEATLRASFIESTGYRVIKDFDIVVKKPVAEYNARIENFSKAFGIIPTNEIFGYNTTIIEAYQGDRALTVENGKVFDIRTSATHSAEDVEITVYDNKCGYTITLEAYYAYITTPEEFVEAFKTNFTRDLVYFPATGKPLEQRLDWSLKEGYIVLANDIDMAGYELDNYVTFYNTDGSSRTFYINNVIYSGTFDGQGHVVKNLTFGANNKYGLFGVVKAANIKNVAFDNVKFAEGATYMSVIGSGFNSTSTTIENVYIRVTQLSNPDTSAHNAAIFTGDTFGGVNLKNIIIDWPNTVKENSFADRSGILAGAGRTGLFATTTNVYVVSTHKLMSAYANSASSQSYIWLAPSDADYLPHIGTDVVSATNSHLRRYILDGSDCKLLVNRYDNYLAMFNAGNDYEDFNDYYWDKSSGIPVFKGISLGEEYCELREGTQATANVEDGITLHLDSNVLTSNVVWTSSDESIATVENGVVTFYKTGAVYINVNVNDGQFEFSCKVTAVLSETPELFVDGLNFNTGDEYRWANPFVNNEWDFDPTLTYAGVTYTEDDEEVSFTYEISKELGSFDEYGVFSATEKGSAIVTVSGTIFGNTVTYKFEVRVTSEIALSINGIEDTTYPEIYLDSTDSWGGQSFVNVGEFVTTATLDGTTIPTTVTVEDESVVKYENGKLYAQPIRGYTADTIVYVTAEDNGVCVTRMIKVVVVKPAVESEKTVDMFSVEDGAYFDNEDGKIKILRNLFPELGEITAATQNGEEIEVKYERVYGVELTDFTGAQDVTFTVYGLEGGYTITVKAYTKVIASNEDFREFFEVPYDKEELFNRMKLNAAGTGMDYSGCAYTIQGSFILAVDIQASSTWTNSLSYAHNTTSKNAGENLGDFDGDGWSDKFIKPDGNPLTGTFGVYGDSKTFIGTFDGNGHTINGLVLNGYSYGIFGNMVNATVKNLGLTNVKLNGAQAVSLARGLDANSTIENVYVDVISQSGTRTGGLVWSMKDGTYRNIIVNYPLTNAGKAQPVGDAAKELKNWIGVEGYSNETSFDQGHGSLFNYDFGTGNVENAIIDNVIVISETDLLGARYGYGYMYFAESDRELYQNADGSWKTDAAGTSYGDYFTLKNGATVKTGGMRFIDGVTRFDTLAHMGISGADFSAFENGLWDMSTGIPQWNNEYAENWREFANDNYIIKTVNGEVSTAGAEEIDISLGHEGASASAVLGIESTLNGLYVEDLWFEAVNDFINIDWITGEISYKEGVTLPAREQVIAHFIIDGVDMIKTFNVVVDYTLTDIGEINFDANTDVLDISWLAEGESIVSITNIGEGENIYVDGKIELENNGNTILYKDVHVTTVLGEEENHYLLTLAIYTQFISTKEMFVEGSWRTGTGSYLLTTDVDMAGAALANSTTSSVFNGYFDGNGHVIENLKAPRYSIFGNLGAKSTVKNLAIVNATISTASTYPLFAYKGNAGAVVSDIYIQVTSIPAYRAGALMFGLDGGVEFTNVIIEFPEYNANSTKITPVGADAKDVMNWVGVKGYTAETSGDQGGSIFTSNYSSYYNYVDGNHYWENTYSYTPKFNNVITISKTKALDIRFGTGSLYFAENEYSEYVNADGSWKTDAAGTSYGEYFTVKKGNAIAAANKPGIRFIKGTYRFDDLTALGVANIDLTAFNNGMWDISTGVPVFVGLVDSTPDWRDDLNSKVVITVNGEVAEDATATIGHEGDATKAIIGAECTLAGVTVSDVRLEAVNGYVNVNGCEISYKEGVALPANEVVKVYYTVSGKEYSSEIAVIVDYTMQDVGEIIFDSSEPTLSAEYFDSAIVSVLELGTTNDLFNAVDGTLNITNNTNRVIYKDVHVVTESGAHYKATIAAYTKVIYTTEEFKEIFLTPDYSMVQTHTIKYNGKTYTETFDELVDTDKVVKNGTGVYMKLSDEFITMLANGATRSADSTTVKAKDVAGAYILGADIENVGSNASTYGYNYGPRTVTAANATKGPVAGQTWGDNNYDAAGYKLAGANAYLYEQRFVGTLNGNGYTISGFTSATQGGLFGTLNNAIIENVAITGVESTSAGVSTGIIAYQNIGADTVIENVYLQINSLPGEKGATANNAARWGAIYYNNGALGTKTSTIRDVVIVMPTQEWAYTTNFGAGIIGSSTSAGTDKLPVTENVVAITKTDVAFAYGHASAVANRRVVVAENDSGLIAAGGKYNSTVVKTVGVQAGLYRYDTIASAISAGKTVVGNWAITANGISWVK